MKMLLTAVEEVKKILGSKCHNSLVIISLWLSRTVHS